MAYKKYNQAGVYTVFFIAAALFAGACSLKPVSAVQVIASPEVSVSFGSKEFALNQYSPQDLEKELSKGAGEEASPDKKVRVYSYQPSGDPDTTARYLIHYPLETMNFELGSNFTETDLTKEIKQSFNIPAVRIKEQLNIPVGDINTSLLAAFNTGFALQPVSVSLPSVPAGVPLPQELPPVPVTITFEGFETLTFAGEGAAIVLATQASGGADYEITAAKMNDAAGTVSSDKKMVTFDLNGKTIGNNILFTFTVKLKSGSGNIAVTPQLQGTIQKATGINKTLEPISVAGGSITIPLPDAFKKAEIKTGSLTLSMTQPSGWENFSITHKTKVTQGGTDGLSIDPSTFAAFGTPLSLDGKKLNDQKTVNYSSSVQVVLDNATYTAVEGGIPVTLNFDVGEFKTITLGTRPEFEQEQEIPVPAEMKKWIKTIAFKKVSATVTLTNGFPAGNDIRLKLKSTAFRIPEDSAQNFPAGAGEVSHTYSSSGSGFIMNINADSGNVTEFDVTTTLIPPGYDEVNHTFTLQDIKTGADIELAGKVALDLDWDKITVNAQNNAPAFFPKEDGKFIDLSNITKVLKKAKLKLHDIPLYLYAGSPLFSNTPNAKISLSAEYKKDGAETSEQMVFLLNHAFKLSGLKPGLFDAAQKGVFTGVLSEEDAAFVLKKTDTGKALSDLLNEYPDAFKLNYTLNADELSITSTQYDQLKKKDGRVELRVDIILDVKAAFTIGDHSSTGGGELKLKELAGDIIPERDIFGRTQASDSSAIEKVLESVRSLQVTASFTNTSGIEPEFIIRAEDTEGKKIIEDKTIRLKGGQPQILSFTKEEWKKIAQTVPFIPQVYLKLDNKEYAIKRDAKIGVHLSAVSQADIDYTITF
ncbi:MAG: hypothetical protein P1P65_09385 [Treponema sp.]